MYKPNKKLSMQTFHTTNIKKNFYSQLQNTMFSNEKKQNKLYYVNRYHQHYQKTICPDFIYKQNFKNIFEIPKIEKIVLNITSKNIINDKKHIIPALVALELISGQKLKWTSAYKSIATFKLRKKQIIGCKVDLTNTTMYCFLEKLITIVLPRVRDFKGINTKILNKKCHLTLGLSEILNFSELENYFEHFEFLKGIDITIVNSFFFSHKKKAEFKKTDHLDFCVEKQKKKSQLICLTFLSGFQFPVK